MTAGWKGVCTLLQLVCHSCSKSQFGSFVSTRGESLSSFPYLRESARLIPAPVTYTASLVILSANTLQQSMDQHCQIQSHYWTYRVDEWTKSGCSEIKPSVLIQRKVGWQHSCSPDISHVPVPILCKCNTATPGDCRSSTAKGEKSNKNEPLLWSWLTYLPVGQGASERVIPKGQGMSLTTGHETEDFEYSHASR